MKSVTFAVLLLTLGLALAEVAPRQATSEVENKFDLDCELCRAITTILDDFITDESTEEDVINFVGQVIQ